MVRGDRKTICEKDIGEKFSIEVKDRGILETLIGVDEFGDSIPLARVDNTSIVSVCNNLIVKEGYVF